MIKKYLPERRLDFFWLRLAVSGMILALFIGLVRLAWYPNLHFQLSGTWKFVVITVAVVLVAGPGLTTLIYRRNKKGMVLDICAILVVELIAVGLAAGEMHERRPAYLVFAIDRFEAIQAARVTDHPFRYEDLGRRRWVGPKLVIARFPDPVAERAELKRAILFEGQPDINIRPDQWYPFDTWSEVVIEKSRPLAALRDVSGKHLAVVDRWLRAESGNLEDYGFLPVQGTARDGVIVIARKTGEPVGMLDLDPWI
ncbi:MAG TPA: hypothetical protein VLA11_03905 [Woeseiaceae bacterium]|jgi:hypothetical protein|nr:hypothetical protein [Woeseiaceae bacterium]